MLVWQFPTATYLPPALLSDLVLCMQEEWHAKQGCACVYLDVCVCCADFEYEVGWQGLSSLKFNKWLPRSELIEKGFRLVGGSYCRRG